MILPAEPVYCRAEPHEALPSFQNAGFVDRQHRIIVSQMLDNIIAHQQIARCVRIPTVSAQKFRLAGC